MRVISLFSGAGGMDLGFVRAGYQIAWANDNYDDAVATYRRNLGDHIILGDIADVDVSLLPQAEVVIGGFPCQGFSVANIQRSPQDGRNKLYLEFVRVVRERRPKYFVAENVKGLLSLARGEILKTVIADFSAVGYRVMYALLNAADFGVPQRRERVFIVGVRDGVSCDSTRFPPPPTHSGSRRGSGMKPWLSVGEALATLPDPDSEHDVPNHGDYSKYKLRFNGYLGHRHVDPERPAPTITARGDMRGGVVVIHHPSNQRRITPREAAVIQGFPIDFAFEGNRTSTYRQIANAVPPPLAEAVATALLQMDAGEGLPVPHGSQVRIGHQLTLV
jgi:DNA (cytosine-5)-methyltransferase 1